MTARQLITKLQSFGEENLDKEVMCEFCSGFRTPRTAYMLGKEWRVHDGKIMID